MELAVGKCQQSFCKSYILQKNEQTNKQNKTKQKRREDKLILSKHGKVREANFTRKETSLALSTNEDVNLQKYMNHFKKSQKKKSFSKATEGFLQNIQFKKVMVVDQYQIIYNA